MAAGDAAASAHAARMGALAHSSFAVTNSFCEDASSGGSAVRACRGAAAGASAADGRRRRVCGRRHNRPNSRRASSSAAHRAARTQRACRRRAQPLFAARRARGGMRCLGAPSPAASHAARRSRAAASRAPRGRAGAAGRAEAAAAPDDAELRRVPRRAGFSGWWHRQLSRRRRPRARVAPRPPRHHAPLPTPPRRHARACALRSSATAHRCAATTLASPHSRVPPCTSRAACRTTRASCARPARRRPLSKPRSSH
jgi:hypothetical protein